MEDSLPGILVVKQREENRRNRSSFRLEDSLVLCRQRKMIGSDQFMQGKVIIHKEDKRVYNKSTEMVKFIKEDLFF